MTHNELYARLQETWVNLLANLRGRRVAVLGHVRPDGDCVGSQVALVRFLRASGCDAFAVNHHPVPRNLKPFVADTPFYCDQDPGFSFGQDCLAVSVDCADVSRLGPAARQRFSTIQAVIDHHVSNRRYGQLNLIVSESAATCEILAALMLKRRDWVDAITAQALYVGIATDTGQFRFPSTSHLTFELCCQLVDCGADPAGAALYLYEQEKPGKMALLQRFLHSFQYYANGRICIGVLRLKDFSETGSDREDVEGFVDYARCIEGVDIGILLEETSTGLKGSFRAKSPRYAVHQLAAQFNGGGHACAAGFNPNSTLELFYPQLVAAVQTHLSNINPQDNHNGI